MGRGTTAGRDEAPVPSEGDAVLVRLAELSARVADLGAQLRRPILSPSFQLLSKRDVCRVMGWGEHRTLNRLIRTGLLKTVWVGKRRKIPAIELERFVREGEDASKHALPKPPKRAGRPQLTTRSHEPDWDAMDEQLKKIRV